MASSRSPVTRSARVPLRLLPPLWIAIARQVFFGLRERRRLDRAPALVDTVGRSLGHHSQRRPAVSAADKTVADETDIAGSNMARPSRSASVEVVGNRSV